MRDIDLKKKHFQHISLIAKLPCRPDEEEGEKELFAEMTSDEERTYKSAMALDSEHSHISDQDLQINIKSYISYTHLKICYDYG